MSAPDGNTLPVTGGGVVTLALGLIGGVATVVGGVLRRVARRPIA